LLTLTVGGFISFWWPLGFLGISVLATLFDI
jgi:hypothetical protein